MKKILAVIIVTLSALGVNASQLAEQGDKAYAADQYTKAIELYLEAAKNDGTSSELYYNIGNCYYRLKQLGKAILYYERALKLDPSNADARANLNFVNGKIIDKPADNSTVMSKLLDKTVSTFTTDTWSWLAAAGFILVLAAICCYIFGKNVTLRKVSFFGGILLVIVTLFTITMAIISANRATSTHRAVITSPSSQLSTSPRTPKDKSEEAIMLHEGTVVEIIDSVKTPNDSISTIWYDVRIDRNHRAWIAKTTIERI